MSFPQSNTITFRSLSAFSEFEETTTQRLCRVIIQNKEKSGESKSVGAIVPNTDYTDFIRWAESDTKIQEFLTDAFQKAQDKHVAKLVKDGKQDSVTPELFTTKVGFLSCIENENFGRLSGEKITNWFATDLYEIALEKIISKAIAKGKVLSEDAAQKAATVLCEKFTLLAAKKIMIPDEVKAILEEYLEMAQESEMKTKLQEKLDQKTQESDLDLL